MSSGIEQGKIISVEGTHETYLTYIPTAQPDGGEKHEPSVLLYDRTLAGRTIPSAGTVIRIEGTHETHTTFIREGGELGDVLLS